MGETIFKPQPGFEAWALADQKADEGDLQTAIRLHKRAAKLGFVPALQSLGHLYADLLKPPELRKSVYWYKRAVSLGSALSAWNLSVHYKLLGDRKRQMHWLNKAAEMGDEDALFELGRGPDPWKDLTD